MSAASFRNKAGARLAELDELELVVEKLVTGGDGLGRFEGIPIFVPRSAPGDRLRVRLTDRRPDYGRAEIVEILEPAEDRREPPCPHFARCGGCDLQHLEDDRQVELKAMAVRETLERIGRIEWPSEVRVIRGASWGYRLRTSLHTRPAGERVEVGYFARGSRDLVPVNTCPILDAPLQDVLAKLPKILRGERVPSRLDLAAGSDGALTSAPVVEGLPHGAVQFKTESNVYQFDARCFFQGHRGLVEPLIAEAVGDESGQTAFDLYAGVGLFSLPLAHRYEQVVAVESDRIAARYARINGRQSRLPNLTVENQSVEKWMQGLPEAADRVVLDPPREGLPGRVRAALLAQKPHRITYVSCDAATLARDLRHLSRDYRIDRMALIDLFPQTGHMETVVQLSR